MIDDPSAPPDLRLLEAFLNTVDERTFRRHGTAHAGGDQLTSPAALSAWLSGQGLHGAERGDEVGETDLIAAVQLRNTLRRALLAEPAPRATVLDDFSLHLATDPAGTLRLTATGDSVLNPIIETIATAVVDGSWARVKICAAPDCHWAFYDTSRSGAGRWCSMEVCGNRTKTRAYRRRHQPT